LSRAVREAPESLQINSERIFSPAIAAAWEAVVEGWREPLPVAWEFLPEYIDAAAELGKDGDVSNAVLDGLEKLRHAVRKTLCREDLSRAMDLE
jgi:hypothetical protein